MRGEVWVTCFAREKVFAEEEGELRQASWRRGGSPTSTHLRPREPFPLPSPLPPFFFIVNKNKIICFLLFRQRCKWQNNNPQPITLVLRTGGPKFCSFYKKILNYWISLRRNSFILWNKWVDFSPRYTCAIFKLWYKIIYYGWKWKFTITKLPYCHGAWRRVRVIYYFVWLFFRARSEKHAKQRKGTLFFSIWESD